MTRLTAAFLVAVLSFSSVTAFAQAQVTVAHFAPFDANIDNTAVDIAVNGEVALEDVKFKAFVEDIPFAAGTYTIDILLANTDTVAITGEFPLEDGKSYTVYATGNGTLQDLQLIAMVDDTDMPDMGQLNARVVHASPFAAESADTEVSVRTAGGIVVNGLEMVPFGVDSGFFPLPADTYDLKIATPDGSVNLIDPLPVPLPAGADVSIFAVGDGVNQPLGVVAIPGGELPTRTPVDNRSNGLWTLKAPASGFGLVLQPMPSQNRLVGKWYQPDAMGNGIYLFFDTCEDDTNDMGEFECSTPGGFDGQMAKTYLWTCSGGSLDGSDEVACVEAGTIDIEIQDCNNLTGLVTPLTGDPLAFDASQLTRPFPCEDDES